MSNWQANCQLTNQRMSTVNCQFLTNFSFVIEDSLEFVSTNKRWPITNAIFSWKRIFIYNTLYMYTKKICMTTRGYKYITKTSRHEYFICIIMHFKYTYTAMWLHFDCWEFSLCGEKKPQNLNEKLYSLSKKSDKKET